MRALVIYESMYGNTEQVARAIGEGLLPQMPVDVLEVGIAPRRVPDDVTLVVVGGPTHAFSMSRARTRSEAAKETSEPLVSSSIGVREWIEGLPRDASLARLEFAAFDTHADEPKIIGRMGSAAGAIDRRLRRLGLRRLQDAEHFWVGGTLGPLRDGEVDRARDWGSALAGLEARAHAHQ